MTTTTTNKCTRLTPDEGKVLTNGMLHALSVQLVPGSPTTRWEEIDRPKKPKKPKKA